MHETRQKRNSEGEFITFYKEFTENGIQFFNISEYQNIVLTHYLIICMFIRKKRYNGEKSEHKGNC